MFVVKILFIFFYNKAKIFRKQKWCSKFRNLRAVVTTCLANTKSKSAIKDGTVRNNRLSSLADTYIGSYDGALLSNIKLHLKPLTWMDGRKHAHRNQVMTSPIYRQLLNLAYLTATESVGWWQEEIDHYLKQFSVYGQSRIIYLALKKGRPVHYFLCSNNSSHPKLWSEKFHRQQRPQLSFSKRFLIWCSLARKNKKKHES